MRILILSHRWLGIASCLLFAMWFATGAVMHFVPFPTLTPAERFAGMSPLTTERIRLTPDAAARALGGAPIHQLRLVMRGERPQYVFKLEQRLAAVYADDGTSAAQVSPQEALQLAQGYAIRRRLDAHGARYAELAQYDQWTVPNGLDITARYITSS